MESRPTLDEMRKIYEPWVDRPWYKDKMKVGDCYGICMEFYQKQFNLELTDYPKIYRRALFDPFFIEDQAERLEDGVIHVYCGTLDDPPPPFSDLQYGDMMVMRLHLERLQGGYSSKQDRLCNHSGIYLGHGYMLHHAWLDPSAIVDLTIDTWYHNMTQIVLRSPHAVNYSTPI